MADIKDFISFMIGALTFLGLIFNFSVLRPLNSAIRDLQGMVSDLRGAVKESEHDRRKLGEIVSRHDEAIKTLYKRTDKYGD